MAFDEPGQGDDRTDPDLRGDDLRGRMGPVQGGGEDPVDRTERCAGLRGLSTPEGGQRRVGLALPAAIGVPFGLSVSDQQKSRHRSNGRARAADYARFVPTLVDRLARTYLVRQRPKGPTMLFGVVWFGLLVGASLAGSWGLALLFGLLGALGALQAGVAWRSARARMNQPLAALIALVLPCAATFNNRVLALSIVVAVIAAVVLGESMGKRTVASGGAVANNLVVASATLRVGLPLGFGGAAVVQLERIDLMAMVLLVMVVSVYDCGHFLLGTTLRGRFAGVWAGLAGQAVVLFSTLTMNPDPFTSDGSVALVVVLAALSCPLGQWLGSWMLPSAAAKAPALRRLDSWLIAAPVVWACAALAS